MTTLAQATLALAEVLGDVRRGVADSGTTSTLVDAELTERQGILAPGTLWILSGTLSGIEIPVDRHAQNTLYFAAQASAVATGNKYAVFGAERFNKVALESVINLALQDLAQFTQWDSSLTTVASQEEYALPAGISNLVSVEIAKAQASPYSYSEHRGWMETNAGYLRFLHTAPEIAGYKIRLGYNSTHPVLDDATDLLNPGINLERLKWEAAAHAWRKYMIHIEKISADDIAGQVATDAIGRVAMAKPHNIMRLTKQPTLAGW
jgi:hypothetical protein